MVKEAWAVELSERVFGRQRSKCELRLYKLRKGSGQIFLFV